MDRYLKLIATFSLSLACITGTSQQALESLVKGSNLKGALVSVQVSDLVTGEVLQAKNADQRLCPASVWKLFTTSAALDALGPDFKFKTTLAYDGLLRNDTLEGNLIIVGAGDPTLGSRHFDRTMTEIIADWTQAVADAGIKHITGKVVANAAHFQGSGTPRTRIWEDMGNYYGASVSGLNINDNTYFIDYELPNEPGELAEIKRVHPEVPGLQLRSEVLTSEKRGDMAYIFGAPGSVERVVRGTLPAGARTYTIKGSLPNPPLFAAHHLRQTLLEKGINAEGGITVELKYLREPETLTTIAHESSPPLSAIIEQVNVRSDNLFAEALLLQLGAKNATPTIEGGIAAIEDYFGKHCAGECTFFAYDGSGLSRFTSVSAHQISTLLFEINRNEIQKKYLLNDLPEAGKEGSMKWFGSRTNLTGNVRAKSGSMEKVKAYAGVMSAFSGRTLSFVVLVNNFEGSGTDIKKQIEKYLLSVYGDY